MMTDYIGMIFLLLTGLVAIYVGILLIKEYLNEKHIYHLYWGISFIVLFVAGVLIILFDWPILGAPLVPFASTLIPLGLALGLLYAVYEDKPYGNWFLIYGVIGLVLILLAGFNVANLGSLGYIFIMLVHIPCGLIIVVLPAYTAIKGETEGAAWFFSIGGLLISIGGMLLAFLKAGSPILSANQIFAILAPLLLLVGAFFTLGIAKVSKWKVSIPPIS